MGYTRVTLHVNLFHLILFAPTYSYVVLLVLLSPLQRCVTATLFDMGMCVRLVPMLEPEL